MRAIASFALLALVIADADPVRADASTPARWSCRAGPQAPEVDTRNRICLAQSAGAAVEQGDTLTLRMDDGSHKTFKDKDLSGELGYGYALIDYYPATHRFVVDEMGPDKTTYTVIDGRTGRESKLGLADPYFSPKGDVYVAITDATVTTDTYKVEFKTADGAPIAFTAQDKTEIPSGVTQVTWTGDDTLRLADLTGKTVILTRAAGGGWRLEPAPAKPPVDLSDNAPMPALPPAPAKDVARCGMTGDGEESRHADGDECTLMLGSRVRDDQATNILSLTLANGQVRRFAGSDPASRARASSTYDLVAYSRDAHAFILKFTLVRDAQPTDIQYEIVDSITGRTKIMPAFPHVSPHGETALTIADDGGIALYDLTAAWTKKVWSRPADKGTAGTSTDTTFLGWVDDTTVRVLANEADVLTIARKGDAWHADAAPLRPAYDVAHISTACRDTPKDRSDYTTIEPLEPPCLKALAGIAARQGQVLTLKLEDGRSTRLISVERSPDDMISYSLIGFHPSTHEFLVYWGAYDESNFVMVDSITGRETALDGFPIYAPDEKHFAVISSTSVEPEPEISIFDAKPTPVLAWTYKKLPGVEALKEADIRGWPTNARLDLTIDGRAVSVVAGPDGKWTASDAATPPASKPAEP